MRCTTAWLQQHSLVSFYSKWLVCSLLKLTWGLSLPKSSSWHNFYLMSQQRGSQLFHRMLYTPVLTFDSRYALTLRIMLANLRRKVGLGSGINTPAPVVPPPGFADMIVSPTTYVDPAMPPPFTMEELGFLWPNGSGSGVVSPSAVPVWLQEQVCVSSDEISSQLTLAVEPGGSGSPCEWLGWDLPPDAQHKWLDGRFRART